MKNIFDINVGYKIGAPGSETAATVNQAIGSGADLSGIVKYLLAGIVAAGVVAIIYFYLLERKKKRELRRSEERFWKNLK
jgi:ABC-type multidrug transport system permease subunit